MHPEQKHFIYRGTKDDSRFHLEIMQVTRNWSNIVKLLKGKKRRLLNPMNIYFKDKGETKICWVIQKLKAYFISRPTCKKC